MAIAAVCLCCFSCAPQGALTPEDAFTQLRDAAGRNDTEAVVRLLSIDSRKKIESAITVIARMDNKQISALSRTYGIAAGRMKNLSVKDYVFFSMVIDKNGSIFKEILVHSPVGVDRNRHRAVVRLENGMEFEFVQEGPYWKFDMTRL